MIDSVDVKSFINKRICSFRIATGCSDTEENIMVRIKAGDSFGMGSACPSDVTHETLKTVEEFLGKVPRKIVGTDERDISSLHRRLDAIAPENTAAKAAVDIAAYDLLSRMDGKTLRAFIGDSPRNDILTDMTIGIETKEVTVKKAVRHTRDGFRALKIKVGLELKDDIGRVAAVRDAVGSAIELRVDANQGYNVDQATAFCEEMHSLGVVFVEQPVKAEDYAGLKKVRDRSDVPIMADECVRSLADARRLVKDEAVDLINIKLMKSAGIYEAIAINKVAEDAGVGTMVGCMGEIQVSIAAALNFVLSSDNVKYCDLDSHFNIIDDPSSGLSFEDGRLIASDRPGIGVSTPMDP